MEFLSGQDPLPIEIDPGYRAPIVSADVAIGIEAGDQLEDVVLQEGRDAFIGQQVVEQTIKHKV